MSLQHLLDVPRRWRGRNTLYDPNANFDPSTTDATLAIAPMLFGRYARIEYTWSYHGRAQEGMLLLGYHKDTDKLSGHWIDSWHQPTVMVCSGPAATTHLAVTGSYGAPTGPDWQWRIEVEPHFDRFELRMVNITPDGEEMAAVEAHFTAV